MHCTSYWLVSICVWECIYTYGLIYKSVSIDKKKKKNGLIYFNHAYRIATYCAKLIWVEAKRMERGKYKIILIKIGKKMLIDKVRKSMTLNK